MLHSYNGILLSNKKKGNIDTGKKVDGSPMRYVKQKKARLKKLYTVWFHLHNTLEKVTLYA